MAYGTKYTITGKNQETGDFWKAYIKKRDYSGANTDLVSGTTPIQINYSAIGKYAGTDYWNIATSTCVVEFLDEASGSLSEILSGDDEEYQIVVENTTSSQIEWTGFVIPDSYSYQLYSSSISTIRATDRLIDLKKIVYASGITPYTGRDDLIGVLSDCLDALNLDLGFATHMNWYPHLGGNELDETDDVLINSKVDRSNLEDTDGNPYNCFDVIENVLMNFHLQMFIVENRWFLIQRKKNVFDSSGSDVFKVYNYNSVGAEDTPDTSELMARREVSVNASSNSFALSPFATGTTPIGSVTYNYYHKAPTEGLLNNVGFESAIQTSGGSGIDNWKLGGPTPTAVLDSPGIFSTQALYIDTIYESTSGFLGIADAIANLSDYVEQTSLGTLEGGTNKTIQVSIDFKVNLVSGAGIGAGSGRVYLFFELHVGSYKCYDSGHTGSSYQWATSPTTDEEKLHREIGYASGSNQNWTFTTEALDDSGDISGAVYFRIYAATEDMNTSEQFESVTYDNITLTILDSDEEASTITQQTLTYSGNVNRSEPEPPTFVFGDGPDSGYKSRLTILNNLGVEQSITSNWSYLPVVSESGFSLHQFGANQWLREFGQSNRKITSTVYSKESSEAPKPYHYLAFENPNNSLHQDYTWNQLNWRPCNADQILSGTFVQFQETVTANQLCTVNVKANTSLLQGISIAEGLPCLGTDDFIPNLSPTHVYYAQATELRKAAILSTPSGWTSELIETITTGRNYLKIAVDEAAGYIFAIEQSTGTATTRYLTRRDLDGGNLTTLLTYNDGITGGNTLSLGRIGSHIYVGAENFGAVYNGFGISRYDYDGSLVGSLLTSTDSLLHALTVDSSETYMFYRENRNGAPSFDRLRRFTIADSTNDILITPAVAPSSNSPLHGMVADDDNGIFYSGDNKIVKFNYSSGTGENNLETASDSDAIGFDRANQKAYYIDNVDDVYRMDYDGTSKESVLENTEAIRSLCLGFN